jgi:hypothetical protein
LAEENSKPFELILPIETFAPITCFTQRNKDAKSSDFIMDFKK